MVVARRIYALGLWAVGLDLGLLIGFIAGLVSFVPYLGAFVGLTAAIIATLVQHGDCLHLVLVLGVFSIGQTLESFVLTPWLVGDRIGLHPVAVIFAIMAGGQLFGFLGVLLALPVAAVTMVLLRYAHERYRSSGMYGGEPRADRADRRAGLGGELPTARRDRAAGGRSRRRESADPAGAEVSPRPAVRRVRGQSGTALEPSKPPRAASEPTGCSWPAPRAAANPTCCSPLRGSARGSVAPPAICRWPAWRGAWATAGRTGASGLACFDGVEAIAGHRDDEVALFHFHNAARQQGGHCSIPPSRCRPDWAWCCPTWPRAWSNARAGLAAPGRSSPARNPAPSRRAPRLGTRRRGAGLPVQARRPRPRQSRRTARSARSREPGRQRRITVPLVRSVLDAG